MASSNSIRKSQIPLTCQLCERDTKIKWKCLDCDLLICENCCKNIHPKVKKIGDHRIVDIKELGIEHSREQTCDFSNIKCIKHSRQQCFVFCKTCDKPVCPKCVTKTHKKHDLVDFEEEYDRKIQSLKDGQTYADMTKQDLTSREKVFEEMINVENDRHIQVKQDILIHSEALKNEVDRLTNELVNELDKNWRIMRLKVEKERQYAEKTIRILDDQKEKANTLIISTDTSDFFEEVPSVVSVLEETIQPLNLSYTNQPTFVPGRRISISNIGTIESKNVSSDTGSGLSVVQMCITDMQIVQFMVACSDNSLWISENLDKLELKKVKIVDGDLDVKIELNVAVYGMALTPLDDLFFSTDGPILKRINGDSFQIFDSQFTVSPLEPKALHLSRNGEMMIGAKSPGPFYPAMGRRVIIIMDMTGKQTDIIEYGKDNNPIFTYPWGITSTTSGNVCVIDRLSADCLGRVVVLNRAGVVINTFDGHEEENEFLPRGIVATKADNILVSSTPLHKRVDKVTIHVLNSDGLLITYIRSREVGVLMPFSLAFSSNWNFFIGGTIIKDSGDRAELYEAKLSGY